jgi:uncharacterized membrane protein
MPPGVSTPASWFAIAALTGVGLVALNWLVLSHDVRVIPGLIASMSALAAVRSIVRHSYPDAQVGGVLELVVIALVLAWWMRELGPAGGAEAAGAAATPIRSGAPATM